MKISQRFTHPQGILGTMIIPLEHYSLVNLDYSLSF